MEPIGCPETSAVNYHYSLRNKPEEHKLDVCLSVHRCICVEEKNQLDVTICFIALMIR